MGKKRMIILSIVSLTLFAVLLAYFVALPRVVKEVVVDNGEIFLIGIGKYRGDGYQIVSGNTDISLSFVSKDPFVVQIDGKNYTSALDHGDYSVSLEGEIKNIEFEKARNFILAEIQSEEEVVFHILDYSFLFAIFFCWLLIILTILGTLLFPA